MNADPKFAGSDLKNCMVKLTGSGLWRYGVAVLAVTLTVLFMLLLNQVVIATGSPFLLFFAPVILSALYGGLEAGILATVLTALAIAYFFLPPIYNLAIPPNEFLRISLFLLQGVFFSGSIAIFQSNKRKMEADFQKLKTKEEHLRLALDAACMGNWDWNLNTGRVIWSKNHELIFGLETGTFKGTYEAFLERIHPEDRDSITEAIDRALATKTDYEQEFRIIWPDGCIRWIASRGKFFYADSAKPTRMLGVMWDISDRKQSEISQKFMSEASKILASSLDYETTLTSVVNLAVPEIADWCAIDILQEDGSIVRLAVAHIDPAKVELAYELHRRYPPDPNNLEDPAMYALKTGKSELVSEIPDSLLVSSARDLEHLKILRQLNLKSYILVPLIARGRSVGVITFVTAESSKKYQLSDLNLAKELARRAALAIENARLYRDSEVARKSAQVAEQIKDESLALLDSLLAAAPMGFAFFNPQLRCVRLNDYIARINGVSIEETVGRTMREYLPGYADIVEPIFQKVLTTGEAVLNVEISGKTKSDEGEQHALANYYPVYSKDKRLLGIGVVIANITTLKKQAEALQKQQEWLEYTLNLLPTPLLFIEPGTARVTFANKAADEMAGGKFPQDKPAEEYHSIYYCTDAKGNRIPDEEMPGVRVARGERLHGFEMNWRTPGGIRQLLVFADTLPPMHGHAATCVLVFQDIAKLKQAEEAVRQSEARFRRLVDANIIGVAIGNFSSNITEANNAFLEMLGYTKEEMLAGRLRWFDITPPEYLQLESQAIVQLKNNGVCMPFEKEFIRKDGSRVPILIGGVMLEGYEDTGIVFAIDLTDRKQMENALRQQAEELSKANRMKDEFLAVVSHELRSPLNAILGWASMLRSKNLNEEMSAKALETIERNARSQKQLIEDLLDVSRIITGKLRLNVQAIELAPIVQTVIESLHPTAQAKDISLTCNCDSAVGKISGDPERLQQIIWNLLTNAIKFTPPDGRVEVRLSLEENSETGEFNYGRSQAGRSQNYAQIAVTDTGMGISPDFLPYVFDRFRQADSTTTRSYGGLGLGLAIVRHLVELHGGTVGVTSPGKGQGSTFTIKLPILKQSRREWQPETSSTQNSKLKTQNSLQPLQGLRLLVVDDDPDAREFLFTALESYGAEVKMAASAAEAIAEIQRSKPDLLLSDIGMPQEDGYSLIRQVRSLPQEGGGGIPAVALTAYARGEDRNRAIAEGFQTHLSKPVEPNELVNIIANLTIGNCFMETEFRSQESEFRMNSVRVADE